jgi:hypothetical protein
MKMPLLKERSRYQKARAALREMMPQREKRMHRRTRSNHPATEHEIPEHEHGFAGLHWMTAGLFVAAGAEAALGQRRGDHRSAEAVRWAPVIAAPMAGAAQAARALWPTPATRTLSQLVNGVALGVGAAGLVSSVRASLREHEYEIDEPPAFWDRFPSLAPLAFGAVGLLGLLLDRDEEEAAVATPAPGPRSRTGSRRRVKQIRIRV